VPVRFEVCGLLLALSLTLNCPVLFRVAVGVNVTLIVHLPLAVRLVVHVVADTAKSPVVEIAMLSSAAVWLFVKVNVFGELVVPTVCAVNVIVAGVSVAGVTPVPENATVCGVLLALSLTLNCPALFPVAVGVNVTLIVHFPLAAKLVVQFVAEIAKSPVVEITTLVSVTVWLLVKVNVFAALVVPTTCAA
jgi:hypothetical protein